MIGCLVIAFALCQTGYYAPPPAYYPPPVAYYAPAPVYSYPVQPYYPVAVNLRVGGGGWGGYGHYHHR